MHYHYPPKLICLPVAVILMLVGTELLQAQPQRAYERGLEELHRGNITLALDTWYSAYESEGSEGSVDGRIGFEYIRVVTEREMREYYEPATELYYRALIDGEGTNSRIAIKQEIERMRPVTGDGIYRQWTSWWEEDSHTLGSDMRGFWVQQDPTPAKMANERLIEHWERISVAKKRFTRNSNTIYGTDDRALIYIRYGEPDRTKNGILTIQSTSIKQWLENQLTNPRDRDGNPVQETDISDFEVMNRLQDAVYDFHRYPEFEVWFYDGIAVEVDESVLFMFGTDVRNEKFTLQTSLDDFIPERAFQPERSRDDESIEFTRAGITPALMLQMLYYEQLAEIDPFFNNRLNHLKDRLIEQQMDAFRGMDLTFKAESRDLINQRTGYAPRERSTYSDLIPRIPMDVYHYRFLNEDLEPVILTYIESSATEAFLIDFYRNRASMGQDVSPGENVTDLFPYYELVHSLQVYDEAWNKIEEYNDKPDLIMNRSDHGPGSLSVFQTPHKNRLYLSSSVELMNYDPETSSVYNTPFPREMRGLNKIQFRQPEPLISHRDSLEMADLVLGYPVPGEATKPFSFVVANDPVIPFEETLMLHFEVYNLKRMDNSFTQFELTYRILPVDDDGKILRDQTEFTLTLNFTNEERHVVEDLEIETADLRPGLYELVVAIEDTETGQIRERAMRFEVVE